MTDVSDDNTCDELANEGEKEHEPNAPLRLVSDPSNKPEYGPTPGVNDSQINKRVQEPSDAVKAPEPTSTPAPVPISASIHKAAKVTFTSKPTTSVTKHDSSISIDEDTDNSANIKLFIVDALAAAITIAFTVLILQDSLPFLK